MQRSEALKDRFVEGAFAVLAGLAFAGGVVAMGDAQQGQQVVPALGARDGFVEFVGRSNM